MTGVLLHGEPVVAQEPDDPAPAATESRPPPLTVRFSMKASGLAMQLPGPAGPSVDRRTTTTFWRARLEPAFRPSDAVTVDVALEQRLRVFSAPVGLTGGGVLPSEARAPYRLRQLDWSLASSAHAEWRAEVDRASVGVKTGAVTINVGRQAIGWGRGVMFGAIDLFAPFSPLEADREWRRGIDAVHAELKIADRVSVDGTAAFDESIDASAFAGRLRGLAGNADVEIVGGRRARDVFGGIASSAAVGDAGLHGELALFRTAAVAGSTVFGTSRMVAKAVAGGSYQFALGSGLLVYAEYHYSGFGAAQPSGMLPALHDAAFRERYLRGDTQMLGRHAAAVLGSYEWSPALAMAGQWLQSPSDGSGVAVPSVTWTASDRWSVMFSGYIPWGAEPAGGSLGSEFGSAPLALFVQVRFYR